MRSQRWKLQLYTTLDFIYNKRIKNKPIKLLVAEIPNTGN